MKERVVFGSFVYGSLLGKPANEQIFQEVDPQKNIVDR